MGRDVGQSLTDIDEAPCSQALIIPDVNSSPLLRYMTCVPSNGQMSF